MSLAFGIPCCSVLLRVEGSYVILHLLPGNQTVKANLKTFTLGLNEDCQCLENVKLYTISSKSAGLDVPVGLDVPKLNDFSDKFSCDLCITLGA